MKRSAFILGVAAVALLISSPGLADPVVVTGDQVTIVQAPGASAQGGVFIVTNISATPNFSFPSFCLEKDESISNGGTYFVQVNTAAVDGGAGGPSPDPLDPKTAWLYQSFVNGTLAGYTGDNASQTALQNAIWYLEEEIAGPLSALAQSFVDAATAASPADIGDVVVLNLYESYDSNTREFSGLRQDILFTPTRVPEPGVLLLLGAGLLGVGGLVRRRR